MNFKNKEFKESNKINEMLDLKYVDKFNNNNNNKCIKNKNRSKTSCSKINNIYNESYSRNTSRNNKNSDLSNIVNLNKTYYSILNKNSNKSFNNSKYITIEDLGGSNSCRKLKDNYKFELIQSKKEINKFKK